MAPKLGHVNVTWWEGRSGRKLVFAQKAWEIGGIVKFRESEVWHGRPNPNAVRQTSGVQKSLQQLPCCAFRWPEPIGSNPSHYGAAASCPAQKIIDNKKPLHSWPSPNKENRTDVTEVSFLIPFTSLPPSQGQAKSLQLSGFYSHTCLLPHLSFYQEIQGIFWHSFKLYANTCSSSGCIPFRSMNRPLFIPTAHSTMLYTSWQGCGSRWR